MSERFERQRLGILAGQKSEWQLRPAGANSPQQFQATHSRHVDVGQNERGRFAGARKISKQSGRPAEGNRGTAADAMTLLRQ